MVNIAPHFKSKKSGLASFGLFCLTLWTFACTCTSSLQGSETKLHTLTLQEAEMMAVCHNQKLNQAFFAKGRDYAGFWQQLSRYLPQVGYLLHWAHTDSRPSSSIFFLGKPVDYSTHILQLDQLVLSLPLFYEIKSAHFLYLSSFFQSLEELVQTVADVRVAHYRVVATRQKLAVQQESLNLYQEGYENEQTRIEVGEGTDYEYKRDLIAYQNALSLYYRTAAEAEYAKSDWVRLLGIPPEQGLCYDVAETEISFEGVSFLEEIQRRVADKPRQITDCLFTVDEIERWNEITYRCRPQIQKTQADYRSAEQAVNSAKGAYFPEIKFTAALTDNSPPEYFGTRREYWEYGVSLNWQILDGFGRSAAIRRGKQESAIARSVAQEASNAALLEVRNLRYGIQNSLYSLRSSMEANREANEAISLAKELVDLGDLTAFEYRDMVQSYAFTKSEVIDAQLNLISSYYLLLAALGLQSECGGAYLLKKGHQCE